jgi:transcriptional regulator with XRE-family HTH domain
VIDLAEMRRGANMTQIQLAAALNTTQGQISRIERQSDMLVSTLIAYLTALRVDVSLVVGLSEQTVTYDLTTPGRAPRSPSGTTAGPSASSGAS